MAMQTAPVQVMGDGQRTIGQLVIDFCERFLHVPDGKDVGKRVVLREWQKKIIRDIYDSRRTGRRLRRAIVSIARKNGKTALIAMLVLAHLVGPVATENGQLYSAAQSKDQAALVFDYMAKMVRKSPTLVKMIKIKESVKEMYCARFGTAYKALSSDVTTSFGKSPAVVIHDELGQVRGPRSELYDSLETAMGAHDEPLSITISTQAATDDDLMSVLIDDALSGADPDTEAFLYTAPKDCDLLDEAAWYAANPALGDFRSLDVVRSEAQKAKRLPSYESTFRNLILNQRVETQANLITEDVWKLNQGEPDEALFFDGRKVYFGLDLSTRHDITALALGVKDDEDNLHVKMFFWTPADTLFDRAKKDKAPYDVWVDNGYLIATPGKTIDYSWIVSQLFDLAEACNIDHGRYDRWRIEDLRREIEKVNDDRLEKGQSEIKIPLAKHGQGFIDMSPAIEEFESYAYAGRIRAGDNPTLKMCVANSKVMMDSTGNRKLKKGLQTKRIDGMVALLMLITAVTRPPELDEDNRSYLDNESSTLVMLD